MDAAGMLELARIDPNARAATLTLDDMLRLASVVKNAPQAPSDLCDSRTEADSSAPAASR
jgi:hypothetical protein